MMILYHLHESAWVTNDLETVRAEFEDGSDHAGIVLSMAIKQPLHGK